MEKQGKKPETTSHTNQHQMTSLGLSDLLNASERVCVPEIPESSQIIRCIPMFTEPPF